MSERGGGFRINDPWVELTLRVALAGYGSVGRIRHACIDEIPDAEVVAVAETRIAPYETRDGIRRYSDFRHMLELSRPDILFVALPNHLAASVTAHALSMGIHVFCEKPPARNIREFQAVLEAERANSNLHLAYGFNHRYHPSVREALRLVRSGEYGRLVDLRGIYGKSAIIRFDTGEWRCQRELAGGGILLDQGIHMVDMMRLMAGDFHQVHSIISNSFWNHDVEDNAYALMQTQSGVVATLQSSATQWRHRFQLDITLEHAAVTLAGILTSTRSYGAETITVATPMGDRLGDPQEVTTRFSDDASWKEETQDFIGAVKRNEVPTSSSSAEALRTMELVYAIYDADPLWKARYGYDWSD